jgi:hypothetical protein
LIYGRFRCGDRWRRLGLNHAYCRSQPANNLRGRLRLLRNDGLFLSRDRFGLDRRRCGGDLLGFLGGGLFLNYGPRGFLYNLDRALNCSALFGEVLIANFFREFFRD